MPLWDIDFSDIDSDTELPEDIDDDEELPEGYNLEFEKVDNFITENLQRAKETKDVALIGFIIEQGILRYTRLGLKQEVLDQQIWITTQLGKGMLKNFQKEAKGSELKTQIAFMLEMIADQKKKDLELRNRVASLRAERDFKKSRLEAVIRSNQGMLNETSHINKRHALIQERLRLDTIEYEREKALRDDLRDTFVGYSEDLDRQLKNAPWLVEKQKEAARKKELEDEIKSLEADIAKIDLIEERNQIAEESERDLPFKQFCVQLAELYVKREKLFKQLEEEKAKVRKIEEERRLRALEESSQMDCTQALLDGDLDDEETLMRMAKHYKIDTQNLNVPMSQMTQESQQPTQQICRKRAQSPAESTASSEANDEDISDGGEEAASATAPPPHKRVSIVEPPRNPDESVDEGLVQLNTQKNENLDESVMEDEQQNEDRSQPEQMETDEREEEEEEEERVEREEEEEEVEQQEQDDGPGSQESQVSAASQESFAPEEVVEQEEVEETNEGFLRPSLIPTKTAPVAAEENEDIVEHEEAETSFNPELLLNISTNSNDPGGDFFDMMNNQATTKRAVADAAGSSPSVPAGDGDFMSMFGGGSGGESAPADGDGGSFSFNFGGGDANETNGGGGGGEFNFFGF